MEVQVQTGLKGDKEQNREEAGAAAADELLRVQEELERAIREEAVSNALSYAEYVKETESSEEVWFNGELQVSKPPIATTSWKRPWEIMRCNVGTASWLSQRDFADLDQWEPGTSGMCEWEPENGNTRRRRGSRRKSEWDSDQTVEEKAYEARVKELEHLVSSTLGVESTRSLKGRMQRLMSGKSAHGSKKDPYADDKRATREEKRIHAAKASASAKFKLAKGEDESIHLPSALQKPRQLKAAKQNDLTFTGFETVPRFDTGTVFAELTSGATSVVSGAQLRTASKQPAQQQQPQQQRQQQHQRWLQQQQQQQQPALRRKSSFTKGANPQQSHQRGSSITQVKQQVLEMRSNRYHPPRPPPSLGVGSAGIAGRSRGRQAGARNAHSPIRA
jgi:hypothetical protein